MAAENIPNVFSDDLDYEVWAPRVKARLVENGVWDVVQNGVPPDPTKIPEVASTIKVVDLAQWRNRVIKDMKALKIIQSSLTNSAFRKTLSVAASSKDLWDLLKKSNDEAKLSRLEKKFEALEMYEEEPMDNYLSRVVDIVEGFENSGNPKPDYEVIIKLLSSLSGEFDIVLPVLEEFMELPDMTLKDLINTLDLFGDHPGEYMLQELQKFYKSIKKAKSEQKWCGVCNKYNHNQVDCYYKPTGASLFGGHCFRCGEQGHRGRACSNTSNQEMMATHAEIDQARNEKPKHRMLAVTFGDSAYDEDMWMTYTTTSNHMTPYAKFFSTLDRTYRAPVGLANGKDIMAEGKGDVIIMMNGVKKTIKNVLFVPGMDRNVLSVGQMTQRGYSVEIGGGECTIRDENGKVFAKTMWEERGLALRLQVIERHPARDCSNTSNQLMMATHAEIDECGEEEHCARNCNNTRNQQMVATHAEIDQTRNVKPSARNPSGGARQIRGNCFRCGEQGHCARDCSNTRNQQQMVATHAQIDQTRNEKPKHQLLTATFGDFTYDEDTWMLYTASTDHMTPHVKFFTTLDRTYRAEVEMGNGSITMAEGKGDVKIMMNGVEVMITSVLFVPRINRNVLSYGKMAMKGYSMESSGGECTIRSMTGKIFARTRLDERGIALRLQVIR